MHSSPQDVLKSIEHLNDQQLNGKSVIFGTSGTGFLVLDFISFPLYLLWLCIREVQGIFSTFLGRTNLANCSLYELFPERHHHKELQADEPLDLLVDNMDSLRLLEFQNSTTNPTSNKLIFSMHVSGHQTRCMERSCRQ